MTARYILGIIFVVLTCGLLHIDQNVWYVLPAGAAVYVLGTVLKDSL